MGEQLDGKYELFRLLGIGGMGEVCAARRPALGDVVAIKRLRIEQDTPENRLRFLAEARAAAHIRHPNVVRVFDFGEPAAGRPYMVMEYLDGPTLAGLLADGALAADRAVAIFAAICAAIEAGHRRGIVHRDIKPANVILTRSDDGGELVKVLDFGLAQMAAVEAATPTQTALGKIVGTCSYLAPEVILGEAPASAASDVFSLGVVLYEMVTGTRPFDGVSPMATLLRVVGGTYRPAGELQPGLSVDLERAIDAALSRDPAARPASPEQLARMAAGRRSSSRIVAAARPPAATDAAPRFSCFVGRDAELDRLRDEYGAAVAGNGRLIVIGGEAGVGKTRVLDRLTAWAREQGAVVLRGRFYDYEGSRPPPFDPFLGMLARPGTHVTGDDAALRDELADATGMEAAGERWRLFTAIAEALAARAGSSPLVLALDDVQWASRLDLDVVEHLYRVLGPRGTLVVLTARPGNSELDRWVDRQARLRGLVTLPLDAFAEPELRAWFDGVFGPLRIRPQDARRLLRATAGNPDAIGEVIRHLLASGVLSRDDEGWSCAPLDEVEVPDTLAAATRARLAVLAPPLRELLEQAAVIGEEIRFATLQRVSGLAEDALEALLEQAVVEQLLDDDEVAAGNDYRFHGALRAVLYADMPSRRRVRVHRAVVAALREIYPDELARAPHVLAHHYHAVGDWAPALQWGLRGGQQMIARHDYDGAELALTRAREARDRLTAEGRDVDALVLLQLDLAMAGLDRALGRLDEARDRFADVAERARALDAAEVALEAELGRARALYDAGDYDAAAAAGRRAAAAADIAGDHRRGVLARMFTAESLSRRGHNLEATAWFDRLLGELGDDDPPALRAALLRARAWEHVKAGEWDQAQRAADQALAQARASGDLFELRRATTGKAAVHNEAGNLTAAVPLELEALELARRLGIPRLEGIALANLGESYHFLGQRARALRAFTDALAIFIDIGDRACEGDCRVNVGRAQLAQGARDEAVDMLRRGVELCAATGRREYEAIGLVHLGEVSAEAGDLAAASASLDRALTIFAEVGSHQLWRAQLARARVARAMGDPTRAGTLAAAARERIAEQRARLPRGFDPGLYDRAEHEAADLASGD